MRRLLPLIVLLTLASPLLAQTPNPTEDAYFIVQMQGSRCGHMHAATTRTADKITSTSDLHLTIKRGQLNMAIALSTTFAETPDHKPVSMKSEMSLGSLPQIDEYTFTAENVQATHTIGIKGHENTRTETLPLPKSDFLTPAAIEDRVAKAIAAGDNEIKVNTLEPSNGLGVITSTMTLLDKAATVEAGGKTVPALKWSTRNSLMPTMQDVEYTDARGQPLRTETTIGGIKLVLIRADKALALSEHDAPELLESTFIQPDKQIHAARTSATGDFVLKCPDCPIGDLPTAGAQTVTKLDEHTAKVHVDAHHASDAAPTDATDPKYTKPSSMITADDPEVVMLHDRALKSPGGNAEASSPSAHAETLRKFTYEFISKKSFDVGFASAAETARTHTGDCTEHAVLLAALLRADHIPSRCVSGIVYADGIGKNGSGALGYHMWTQALLNSKWQDLDAALSDTTPFDATHIAIQTLSLADGETINALMDILPTLGKLKVHIDHVDQPAPLKR